MIFVRLFVSALFLVSAASASAEDAKDPQGTGIRAFRAELARDGFYVDATRRDALQAAACAAGYEPSCKPEVFRQGGKVDRDALADLMDARCRKGDAVGCLVAGWSFDPGHGPLSDADREQRASFAYKAACTEGRIKLYDACPELAWHGAFGRGTRKATPTAAVRVLSYACDRKRHAPSCVALADLYLDHPALAADGAKALPLYEKACAASDPIACFRLASSPDANWTDDRKLVTYGELCTQGHAASCVARARLTTDPRVALEAWQTACDHGIDDVGCFPVADALRGTQLPADAARARELFGRACAAGDRRGCAGDGVLRAAEAGGLSAAMSSLHQACGPRLPELLDGEGERLEVYAEACALLGGAYYTGSGGLGGKDLESAVVTLERACPGTPASQVQACFTLAAMHETGEGLPRDRVIALELYDLSCQSGNNQACARVVSLADERANLVMAVHAALELCEQGQLDQCIKGGEILSRGGPGLESDPAKAQRLLARACDANIPQGCVQLGVLHQTHPVARDLVAGRTAYQRAADLGSPEGLRRLAEMTFWGWGGPRRRMKGRRLFNQACQLGDQLACWGPR